MCHCFFFCDSIFFNFSWKYTSYMTLIDGEDEISQKVLTFGNIFFIFSLSLATEKYFFCVWNWMISRFFFIFDFLANVKIDSTMRYYNNNFMIIIFWKIIDPKINLGFNRLQVMKAQMQWYHKVKWCRWFERRYVDDE